MDLLPFDVTRRAFAASGDSPDGSHREPPTSKPVQQYANGFHEVELAVFFTEKQVLEDAMRVRVIMNEA
jgi:hypothetical protein